MRYTAQHTKQTATVSAEQGNEPVVHKTGGRISQFIQHSKELVRFYKDGLKQIWSNYQLTKEIRGKLEKDGMDSLTRQEFQLLRRSQKDMIKLIPFGFIFMILPESIPLFVIFVPGMIPSTCLKENQIRKQREKLDEKRQQITKYTLMSSKKIEAIKPEDFLSKDKFRKLAIHYGHEFDLQYIMRKNLSAYCRFMGLSDFGPAPMLRKRLAKHMNYLDQDDRFLIKENSVDTLSPKELCQAVEERGMRSIDDDEENMRRGLKYWLSLSQPTNPKQTKIPPGLLVFSRVFLLNATYK
ncbi:LETM1-like protein-domain-containing protein [Mycotypha africana]|uniref:LETM1-like protein-domain-containing protein n=1 Tax=Mycotypha africana TaxID=64632 RepID=UPI00230023E3|nr:LETM1-like protein-domain-containing protein [Mycotypha africana]KAI8979442.1 LETM1-like protein-domain-containing protein [Mycotypha africana]